MFLQLYCCSNFVLLSLFGVQHNGLTSNEFHIMYELIDSQSLVAAPLSGCFLYQSFVFTWKQCLKNIVYVHISPMM